MVELLNEVDTEGVPFTSNVAAINYMREDVPARLESGRAFPKCLKERGYIVPAIPR